MTLSKKSGEMHDLDKFEKPSVTVDLLIMAIIEDQLKILLEKRNTWPFEDCWALPGRFVSIDESLEEAVRRELDKDTGVTDVYLEQLYTFGDVDRDPRRRVITVTYIALMNSHSLAQHAAGDPGMAEWFPIKHLPKLAFDHQRIVDYGLNRLRSKLEYSNIAYGLLPEEFRLSELQKVYEIILDRPIDKRNFRKKILSLKLLEATGEREIVGAHRPAMLYRFKEKEIIFFE